MQGRDGRHRRSGPVARGGRRDRGTAGPELDGIRGRAPDADIVLVGYPHLVPEAGRCDLLPLATGDYDYVRGIWVELGPAMADAAAAADVTYVDLLGPSRGRDICAGSAAWVNGLVTDERAAALHPDAEEQAGPSAISSLRGAVRHPGRRLSA